MRDSCVFYVGWSNVLNIVWVFVLVVVVAVVLWEFINDRWI